MAVRLASAERDIDLDYTPGSLDDVDWFIENVRERGLCSDEVPEALFVLGCYIGEVLVRPADQVVRGQHLATIEP